jgi:streptomycin 6-kinase
MRIPRALAETWSHEREWLEALPRLSGECAVEWSLALEEPIDTPHSLVVPAGEVVLKLNAPSHTEADTEPDALAFWGGKGAVRLVARDDARRALLVERCVPGARLWDTGVDEIGVMADLLQRLQVEVGAEHPFTLVADEAERWAEEVPRRYGDAGRPFGRRLLEVALDVYRTVDRSATWLVNQDLHGGNVLSATREPWLVIDPKPLAAEREFAVAPIVRSFELGHSKREALYRLDRLCAELSLDRERARGWTIVQTVAWSRGSDYIEEHMETVEWIS